MGKKFFIIICAAAVLFFGKATAEAAEYHMISDTVEGENIETFTIERPDPEALKNNRVNASTFGLSVDAEDNYKAFAAALEYCRNHPNTLLSIDKGVYYFKTNATLKLSELKNVLIDGNGAEFIFETQKQFSLEGCDGVEIRNLIIDWNWAKDRVASLVKIQNKTDNSFEIKFLELDEVDENIPIISFQQYDTQDLVPGAYGSWKTFNPSEVEGSILSVEKTEPNVLKIEYGKRFTTSFHNEEVYILRHYTYGGAVFNVNGGSTNITFDNVRIYGSAGMGFVFCDKANHFQLVNSYIGLRPGSEDKQRMSTTADGIHIVNTGGYFRIDGCDFSYTGDDIMNIHDDLFMITSFNSRSQCVGKVQGSFVQKGDKVRVYDRNMNDIGFEAEVTAFTRGEYATLTLSEELPAEVLTECIVRRSSCNTRNYVVSNNYIHETKGRIALLYGSDGLFENNTMYRNVSEGVEVRVDTYEKGDVFWNEGPGANNVVIKDNVFTECGFGEATSIIMIDCNRGTSKEVLSDIHIINNEFQYCYGAKKLISADNVTGLYIENNRIVDCAGIQISDACVDVYESGNIFSYPSATCPHTDTKQVRGRQPGCFAYGSTGVTYCNQCHTIVNDNFIAFSPLKHANLLVKRIDVAPTCTEEGVSSMVCSLCKTVVETGIVEPPTGHSYAAVTTAAGNVYHKCVNCDSTEMHNGSGADGICSVCGYGKQVEVTAMSLELEPDNTDFIGINLYIDAPAGTLFYVDDQIVVPVVSADSGLSKIQYRCAPKELADSHILTAKDSQGKAVTVCGKEAYTYSGEMYCGYVLSAESEYSEKLKNVCSSLSAYSEQARNYFAYNNAGLAVEDITAKLPSSGSDMRESGELPAGCAYMGSTLILGDEVVLRHRFTGDSNRFRIVCTDVTKRKSIPVTVKRTEEANLFSLDIPVPYANMSDLFELKISTAGNSTPYLLYYGALTYCRNASETNEDRDLINVCNALYNFSAAVSKYIK